TPHAPPSLHHPARHVFHEPRASPCRPSTRHRPPVPPSPPAACVRTAPTWGTCPCSPRPCHQALHRLSHACLPEPSHHLCWPRRPRRRVTTPDAIKAPRTARRTATNAATIPQPCHAYKRAL